jgi:copper chaperone CopZ
MTLFTITGMTCGGCSGSVTRALENAGFKATVDLANHTATVDGAPDPAVVIQVIVDAGFNAVLATETAS